MDAVSTARATGTANRRAGESDGRGAGGVRRREVGGLNPGGVELCLKIGGKIVWFPTIASEQHIAHHAAHPNLNFPKLSVQLDPEELVEVLDLRGAVKPGVVRILEPIKQHDAILASGHMAPREITAVFETAREVGPERSILGSDLGQMSNPLPTDSFRIIMGRLLERAVPEDQIRSMGARNPAELLGAA